jgi:hypothetical protein
VSPPDVPDCVPPFGAPSVVEDVEPPHATSEEKRSAKSEQWMVFMV